MRQCIGCREMKSKKEMLRVIRTPEGEFTLDGSGKKNGRGAYLCFSRDCLSKALKSHALERSFQCPVPKDITLKLEKEFESIEQE